MTLAAQLDTLRRQQTSDRLIRRDRAASRPLLDAGAQEISAQFVTGSGAVNGVYGGNIDYLRNAVLPYEPSEFLCRTYGGRREKHRIPHGNFEMRRLSVDEHQRLERLTQPSPWCTVFEQSEHRSADATVAAEDQSAVPVADHDVGGFLSEAYSLLLYFGSLAGSRRTRRTNPREGDDDDQQGESVRPRFKKLELDEALIALFVGTMDANRHVAREELARAHHLIWSTKRFRRKSGEAVGRVIDRMKRLIEEQEPSAVRRRPPGRSRRS
jgi:hypothetical protein